jgi:hypothetical protein
MSREGNGTDKSGHWRAMLLLHHVDSDFPRERESLAFTRGQDHRIGRRVVYLVDEMTLQRWEAAMICVRIQNGTDPVLAYGWIGGISVGSFLCVCAYVILKT